MPSCIMCGSEIPDNQGSKTCSMCYGDPNYGKDGYYRAYLDEWERQEQTKQEEADRLAELLEEETISSE